jgi:hypothetical protein
MMSCFPLQYCCTEVVHRCRALRGRWEMKIEMPSMVDDYDIGYDNAMMRCIRNPRFYRDPAHRKSILVLGMALS